MFSANTLNTKGLGEKKLCLTFDDGPGETVGSVKGPKTLSIAKYLFEEGISATFFFVGKFIKIYPHILPEIISYGHTIGNHTYSHPHLPNFFQQNGDIISEIIATDELLHAYQPNNTFFFRPPYGAWLPDIADQLNTGLQNSLYDHIGPIGYDIDTFDWSYWEKGMNEEICAQEILKKITDAGRGIILMHDSSADDDAIKDKNLTFETIKIVIPELKRQGYTFCRLDELTFSDKPRVYKKKSRISNLFNYGIVKYIKDHVIK